MNRIQRNRADLSGYIPEYSGRRRSVSVIASGREWTVCHFYRTPAEGTKARKAVDIPVQEAACAARYLAVSQYGMPYENLITETAKSLGLSRAPADSDNYKLCKRAIDYCIRQELLELDDDGFVKEKRKKAVVV